MLIRCPMPRAYCVGVAVAWLIGSTLWGQTPLTPKINGSTLNTAASPTLLTITGVSFGSGTGSVTLDGVPLAVVSWSDTNIVVQVPASIGAGSYTLVVTNALSHQTGTSVVTIAGPAGPPGATSGFHVVDGNGHSYPLQCLNPQGFAPQTVCEYGAMVQIDGKVFGIPITQKSALGQLRLQYGHVFLVWESNDCSGTAYLAVYISSDPEILLLQRARDTYYVYGSTLLYATGPLQTGKHWGSMSWDYPVGCTAYLDGSTLWGDIGYPVTIVDISTLFVPPFHVTLN